MQKWEYLEITLGLFDGNNWSWSDTGKLSKVISVSARLTQLGREGWELVSAYPQSSTEGGVSYTKYIYYIFKRPI